MNRYRTVLCSAALLAAGTLLSAGCQTRTTEYTSGVNNTPTARVGNYEDASAVSGVGTANVESNDIVSCAKYLVGKMLANPLLVKGDKPPQVIVDAKYFTVDASQRIDKDLVVNELRTELLNAANGRMRFVGRQNAGMVEEEKALQAQGVTGAGTNKSSATQLGADYRLTGSIRELATNAGGRLDKFTVMTFEMVDVQTSEIVFSDKYQFKKVQQVPAVYR
jgi:hypothetical protein